VPAGAQNGELVVGLTPDNAGEANVTVDGPCGLDGELTVAVQQGGQPAIWGDNDCNDSVAATDALKTLQDLAAIPYQQDDPCFPIGDPVGVTIAGANVYPWGDTDCNAALAATDALAILRHLAALQVNQEPGCPLVGSDVLVQP
jgi:hypothetical protein